MIFSMKYSGQYEHKLLSDILQLINHKSTKIKFDIKMDI